MKAYKEGDRAVDAKNADMKKALDALNDEDLKHVALYYAHESDSNLTAPGAGSWRAAGRQGGSSSLRQVPRRRRNRLRPGQPKSRRPRTRHTS